MLRFRTYGLGQSPTRESCLNECELMYGYDNPDVKPCQNSCTALYPPSVDTSTAEAPPPPATTTEPPKAPTGKGSSLRPFSASTQAPRPNTPAPASMLGDMSWQTAAFGGAALALILMLLSRKRTPTVVTVPAVPSAPAAVAKK